MSEYSFPSDTGLVPQEDGRRCLEPRCDPWPADQDRFICIHPAYLNSKKTIMEGGRIPINKAVENSTATERDSRCVLSS